MAKKPTVTWAMVTEIIAANTASNGSRRRASPSPSVGLGPLCVGATGGVFGRRHQIINNDSSGNSAATYSVRERFL